MLDLLRDPVLVIDEFVKVTTSLSTERDLHRLLDMIVTSARKLTCSEAGRIYVLGRTKRHLYLEVSQNDCVQAPAEHLSLIPLMVGDRRNEKNIRVYCAFTGKLVNVADAYRYSGFDFGDVYAYDRSAGYRTQSVLVVPLRSHEGVTNGVLELVNIRDPDTGKLVNFPPELEKTVVAFASQAAVAIDNVQLIEQKRRLIQVLDGANRDLEEENRQLREKIQRGRRFHEIIGDCPSIRRVFDLMDKVRDSGATVLVRGETGTGKELIARAIHDNSPQRDGPFIVQNCAALPAELLESELFGYQKGAFTGADADRKGLIEAAAGGTLFLDEIGDMPVNLQAKLLRVLQDGEVRPLGSLETRTVDVRVVAATHCDLEEKIRSGEFREDLYYRLCVFPIDLPPLRERRADVPALLHHFLAEYSDQYKKDVAGFSPASMEALLEYEYPGNIRELRNLVERAVLLCVKGGNILPEHLPTPVAQAARTSPPPGVDQSGLAGLKAMVGQFEASVIERKLAELGWNQTRAAEELRISRRALIDKMNKYKIRTPRAPLVGDTAPMVSPSPPGVP
jgi:sigma-54-dependent transcriptional regulator